MANILEMSPKTLESLVQRAAQEGCTVDELVTRLLDPPPTPAQTQESLYRLIIENSHDPISLHSLDGGYTYANPIHAEVLGYTVDELMVMPAEHAMGMIHPEDLMVALPVYQRVINGESVTRAEFRMVRKDGATVWVLLTAVPIRNEQGQVTQIMGMTRDITDRKRTEAALLHSETLMREVLDSVEDVVWSITIPDSKPLYVSSAVQTITGRSIEEFYTGAPIWRKVVHPQHADALDEIEREVAATGWSEREFPILRPDGETRWVSVRAWLVRDADGQPQRIVGIASDVTDERKTQELLELRYSALEATANAIMIADRKGYIQWVNPAFTRMTGYSLEEARGKNPNALVRSGFYDDEFYSVMWDTILSGQVWIGRLTNRRKDGTLYTEEQTITPVRNSAGEITHFIAVKQDVTERERTEQLLLEHERLKSRFRREQEQNFLIVRTISALSHDLRTPLSVISVAKDILSRYFDRLSLEVRQQKLDSIGRQLQYALELLDDTVGLVNSNLNHRIFHPALVNLDALCQISVDEISETSLGHTLKFLNVGGVKTATVDEILLSRILLNLLTNAIKYSPQGGEVRLELDATPDRLVLRVIDHGLGIDPDDVAHIFEPFYRAASVKAIKGTGLGLSIVKDCVDRHNGAIRVESVVGQGTTFIVELPK